jgi:hypothetical protein
LDSNHFHSDQQRTARLRQARLGRLDTQLRGLNELRECTDMPDLRKLLDERLSQLGDMREALDE